jgi:PKD repeat protein
MQRVSSFLGILALAATATAQFTLVIPNGMAAAEGSTANAFPWGRGGTGLRLQTIYDSQNFTLQGVSTPIIITGLKWRPNGGVALSASSYTAGCTVQLSTSPVDQSAASLTFAANQGADLQTCYSGVVSWNAQAAQTGPTPFGIDVPFQNNFLYDPNLGDLNIECDLPIQTFTGAGPQLDVHGTAPLASRVYLSTGYVNGGPNATGLGVTLNHGVVVEVTYLPANGLFAGFTANTPSVPVGGTVNFTDASYSSDPLGVLSWAWDLNGDSVIDSTVQNPTFTYGACGNYNVSLTVTDASHPANTLTRTGYIQVGTSTITPSFTFAALGGGAYQFTDTSSPTPASWAWDLDGDNLVDSTVQNPVWAYGACQSNATVTLNVSNSCAGPWSTSQNLVLLPPITPSFSFASIAPGVFQFTDTSSPTPTTWAWDFDGDNIIDSTAQNPVWAFSQACAAVSVSLTVSSACGGPWSTTQSIVLSPLATTTLLTGGNGLSAVGSGNTFDIQVTNPNGVAICAITMCPYMATPVVGTPLGCTIWVTDAVGGYLSNHTNAAVWRQVATGTGTFAGGTFGAPIPVPMTLSNPIYLPAGTYGMAVHMTTGCGVAYTTLTAQTTYPGTDFDIIAGNGKGAPFNATANNPRGFNGTFHYSVLGNGDLAGYGFFAAGCAGSQGITNLSPNGRPALGSSLAVTLNNLPSSAAIMLTGFSNTGSIFGPLPLSTTPYGAPGCFARVSTEASLFVFGASNSATWNFNIPNNPGVVGVRMFNQALVLDPGFNALGAVLSDAAAMMIGL